MNIFFDHQVFSYQDFGGISVIFGELTKAFRNTPQTTVTNGTLVTGNINFLDVNPSLINAQWRKLPKNIRMKLQKRINQPYTNALLTFKHFDIVHPTYYEPAIFDLIPSKTPSVLHVHDTIQELFDIEKGSRILEQKRQSISRATHIIAISENTKKDIMKFYQVPSEKISVIYLAADGIKDPKNYDEAGLSSTLPKKYILFDGNHSFSYKNFIPFITAIAPLLQQEKDLYFICNGGGNFTDTEKALFTQLGIEKQMISLNIGNSYKMQGIIFANATLFVYPSKYEGFGIPLVQSMLWNVPVACSNSSCFPEICQDAAFYFDPENPESMLQTIDEALHNKTQRADKIRLGAKRASDFSWKRNAEQTLTVYRELL